LTTTLSAVAKMRTDSEVSTGSGVRANSEMSADSGQSTYM